MKFAILLTGIHYDKKYIHHANKEKNDVYINDYRNSFDYIKTKILNCIKDYDIYLHTNKSNVQDELLKDYKPKRYIFEDVNFDDFKIKHYNYSCKSYPIRNHRLMKGLEMIKNTRIKYDFVIVTRFDLNLKLKFSELKIDYDYDWVVSHPCNKTNQVDDNFWIIKCDIIDKFINLIRYHERHRKKLKTHIINIALNIDKDKIFFIFKEGYSCDKSPLFEIVR